MATRLTNNRHPLLIDHATQAVVDLTPGETLHAFLYRHIENLDSHKVVVQIGGVDIPAQHWTRLRPKDGQHIVVRSTVHKSALLIVALVALTIFTAGAAAAIAGTAVGGGALGALGGAVGSALLGSMGATAASIAVGAMQVIGALVINKVLGPKAASASSIDRDEVYTLSAASNSARQYEPFGILFGEVKVTPDYLSLPYYSYKNNDQYMSFIMTPGLNVASYGDLYFGDTLLSTYQEVTVWKAGFSGMTDDTIPISTNVDTVSGATLDADVAVVRTTPTETTRIQVDITYLLFDLTSKGKKKNNQENVVIAISPVTGTSGTTTSRNVYIVSQEQTEQRRSYTFDVIEGQYDVTVTRQGNDTDGSGATCEFTWATLTAYQKDDTDYTDTPRIAIEIKASGQINGTPDQINATMVAEPIPYWNGTAWTTATDRASGLSNPGANILKYLRGYYDSNGVLMAGMGLSDDMIDIESFQGFMVHCAEWELYYDAYIQSDRNHEDALSAMALAGMGYVDFSPGRATAIWCSDEQGVEGVVSMANMKKTSFQLNYTLATAADGIEYSYFDRESWETKTLYVAAPGVDNPVNYAQVSGEGVTTEAHAAIMARYHMAQMLYQFKDINFGTDLEHLVYHRLSMIQLSHDLTQWGYSGRLKSITLDGSRHATLVLDEEVPASIETAYIGLRLPTETGYRVYQVETRLTSTSTIELVGALPTDFVIPEKAHDIIWIFDFKTTPGLRCRVISIAPEDDLNGAVIGVVPEGDEFWNYVKTGEYIPPSNESLLDTRPRVSNLKVGEEQVVQGDTVFTRLWATWDVSGPSRSCTVYCAPDGGELETVAETDGRSAKWRIDGAGTYIVSVRAFNYDGWPSALATATYTTSGADVAPVNVDSFSIVDLGAGVRKYTWDWNATTIQSADLAGVNIRYVEGNVTNPEWDSMTPIGATGFHSAPFVSTEPESGVYTFACRAVNTSGTLSDAIYLLHITLDENLTEVVERTSQSIVDNFNAIEAETQARISAIAQVTSDLADEAQERIDGDAAAAQAIADSSAAQTQALLNAQTEFTAAIGSEAAARQSEDESLAYQISQLSAGSGTQFDSFDIWYFDSSNEGWNGTVSEGYLNPGNVMATSPSGIEVPASSYRYLKMRVKRVGTPTWQGTFGWYNGTVWDSATLVEPDWGVDDIATIEMDEIDWAENEAIDQIRFQLGSAVDATNYYLFDWIAIGRPTPGASVALVQQETQARIAGDSANASQITQLGVQVRGDYTGTDIAGVTQGLLYSERTTRADADNALSEQIVALTATVGDKADASALQTLTARVDTVEDDVTAMASSVQLLEAQLDGEHAGDEDEYTGETEIYAGSLTVYTVIADGDSANASAINSLSTEFGSLQSSVNSQVSAISNAQTALASQVDSLSAAIDDKADASAVNTLAAQVQTNSDGITALAQSVTSLSATVSGKADASALSALSATVSTQGTQITALGESITSVSATVAGKADASVVQSLSATVTTQGNSITSVLSQYFLSVNSNGYIGGMKIGNDGSVADFTILSDVFTIVSPAGGARTEYSDGNWRVYDSNNVLRVRMGVWS